MEENLFTVTMMDNRYNKNLHPEPLDLESFIEFMEKPYEEEEKGLHACLLGECTYELEADGKRHRRVVNRCMGYLDADDPQPDFLDRCREFFEFWGTQWAHYNSFSATPERPKMRVVFQFSRTVTPEDYKKIMRAVCYDIARNSDEIDPVSTLPSQLMFLPCVNINLDEPYYHWGISEGSAFDVDKFLEWIDMNFEGYYDQYTSSTKSVAKTEIATSRKATAFDPTVEYLPCGLKDPRSLNSIIASFCRVYDIPAVLDDLIPGTYIKDGSRYQLASSSSPPGAMIKPDSDEQYFYSLHRTDPIYGRDVNAWDLTLHHMFSGDSDAMYEWAKSLPEVQVLEKQRHEKWKHSTPSD